jgi:hypothetical protein
MKEKEIEQLFSDGFANLEGDVNPGAWANIEKGLKAPAEPTPAITSAVRGGLFNYTGLLLTVAAAGIVTAVYFGMKKSGNGAGQPLASTQAVKEQTVTTTAETKEQYVASEPQTSTNSAQKPAVSAAKQNISPVKKNSVVQNKSEAHPAVSSPINTSQATTSEPNPAVNVNHPTPAMVPPVNESTPKSNAPGEVKQTLPATNSNTLNFEADKPKLKIFMPTGFRPEVDPAFGITGEDVNEFVMTIYDSRGNIVFNSSESNQTWDGKLKNGEPAPAGKYKVAGQIIDNSGAAHPSNGFLTIVR